MSLLLLLGEEDATQGGYVSYIGWWMGGQGSVPAGGGAKPWLVGRTVTIVTGWTT